MNCEYSTTLGALKFLCRFLSSVFFFLCLKTRSARPVTDLVNLARDRALSLKSTKIASFLELNVCLHACSKFHGDLDCNFPLFSNYVLLNPSRTLCYKKNYSRNLRGFVISVSLVWYLQVWPGAYSRCFPLVGPGHRLDCKGLPGTSTLAYYEIF
jgi:hypothetical protein